MVHEVTEIDIHEQREPTTTARFSWGRALRGVYLVFSCTIVLALLLETGWRVAMASTAIFGGKRPGLVQVTPENVPYTLHPYFQVLPAPTKDHERGPFLAGWAVSPPEAVEAIRTRILPLASLVTPRAWPRS
jgi:hypothetical protein